MKQLNTFQKIVLGIQMLFVAFGAVVLVPLLVGIDPAVALFTAGAGTLLFHLVTGGIVPVFLGSSFVFIVPIIAGSKLFGLPGVLCGLIFAGIFLIAVSFVIRKRGIEFIQKIFPPVVIGPVIITIGLSLATVGVEMATTDWLLATISLAVAISIIVFGKKMFKLLPVIGGISAGYIVAIILGKVNFSAIASASWFSTPKFVTPEFSFGAILYILPFAIAPLIEHIGDMYAISHAANKNFIKNPGIHRTLLGDGLATVFSGFFGGPPDTTYSEVTGAITLTKLTDPILLRIAAITAIILAFIGKISGFLLTIPQAVLGGIMLLLFGMISVVGIRSIIDSKADLNKTKNMVIVSVMLTIGVGGAVISYGTFSFAGVGLASVVGIALNLILPNKEIN